MAEVPQVILAPELASLRSLLHSEAPPSEYHPSKSLLRPRPPHEAFHEHFVAVSLPEHTPRRASPGPCLRCASTSETFVGYLRVSPSGAHFDHLASAEDLDPPYSEVTPSGVPFEVPRPRGLRLGVPSPGATLRTYCLHLAHLDSRTDLDPFAAFVTELPAPLASSLPLDPDG
ncbi:hypothetical protein GUJ93_ZPchr0221g7045 [Zizania palustris]|uniref:Uncharacterized protein n=1 Tax=Zizania palustris TaxID=103762 RepID=A0A8J5V057_ZIZPA|nr:hypothetical protein GUJ93_ZPchr0221g7045 [Zizania palustris]